MPTSPACLPCVAEVIVQASIRRLAALQGGLEARMLGSSMAPGRTPPPVPVTGLPPLQSKRLLDQLRERIRFLHYSLRTEDAYLY